MTTLYINVIENIFYCFKLKMMQWLQMRLGVKRTFNETFYINTRNETLFSYVVEATNLLTKFFQSKSKDKRRWMVQYFGDCSSHQNSCQIPNLNFIMQVLLFHSVLDQTVDKYFFIIWEDKHTADFVHLSLKFIFQSWYNSFSLVPAVSNWITSLVFHYLL